jgi:hypothetical protein
MFEASIEHIFPFNHKLTLRGRYNVIAPAITNNQIACALEYEIPIGVPIKRISEIGQLRGSIIDEQGKGVANVLVSIGGNAALSDKQGNFYFASLTPGSNFVLVDMASIGFNRITKQPIPLEVIIRGGVEIKIVLSITRSVTIAGNITLLGTDKHEFGDTSTALAEIGGKSSVFLEISNGTEINRRVSDSHGRFLFADLRPGNWILKVTGGDIPENHIIDPEEIKVDLAPGEKIDVKIQLRPRKRTIKMLQEGLVIQEKSVAAEKKIVAPPVMPTTVEKKIVTQPAMLIEKKPCLVIYDEIKNRFAIQISSWSTKAKALRLAKEAKSMTGLQSYVKAVNVPSVGLRYRVYIGSFKTLNDANTFCREHNFD